MCNETRKNLRVTYKIFDHIFIEDLYELLNIFSKFCMRFVQLMQNFEQNRNNSYKSSIKIELDVAKW